MSIVTIHQIEHAPHLSLFKKFAKADIIILGDTFQFKKNYFENRNKIKANNKEGWEWITVPVESHNHKPMKDIKIINDSSWKSIYLLKIGDIYKDTPYFDLFYPQLYDIIDRCNLNLMKLNMKLLYFIMNYLHIFKPIILLSELNIDPALKSTDLLVEICKKCNATIYLSGPSGKEYLELEKFGNIEVQFHEKAPGLSVLDDLFTKGEVKL